MLESFFAINQNNGWSPSLDSFPIAVPLPSKRGPLACLPNNYNFGNNIMTPIHNVPQQKPFNEQKLYNHNVPQQKPFNQQKPYNHQKPLDEIKNLKTIIEEVKNADNDIFTGELTKTQKEIVNLKNMENPKIVTEFSKVFSDKYNSIAPLLVNGNLDALSEQCKVEFNPF